MKKLQVTTYEKKLTLLFIDKSLFPKFVMGYEVVQIPVKI